MPRGGPRPGSGGARPGAGRPAKNRLEPPPTRGVASDIRAAARAGRMSPLDYMLGVLNDPEASPERRDRMAQAAAPYVHPKAGEKGGKKEEREANARTAERGTDWEALLN